ncbi:uncharacterized protein LOC141852543 [Brevipalpus obovatus]|uniref:uncharacterized protein LOC141852543 n=1 Tax=Brevipalpus obovatus TaxID=246614 RepID=UPI003D9EF661
MKIHLAFLIFLLMVKILLVQSRSLDASRQTQVQPTLEQEYSKVPSHDDNDSDLEDEDDDKDEFDDKFWADSEEEVSRIDQPMNYQGQLGHVPFPFWDGLEDS